MGRFFGTDGMRGTVGEAPLVPELLLKLGLAVGRVMQADTQPVSLIIGRDTRQSGQLLQSALIAGLLTGGVNVIDAGVIPTAGIAYLIRRLGLEAGAVISASHNPVEQNGVKLVDAQGLKFPEKIEDEIEACLTSETFDTHSARSSRLGRLVDGQSYHDLYIQGLLEEHKPGLLDGRTLVIDCSNGAASAFAPQVFSQAGARVITLHASPDGTNINSNCGSEFARRAPWEVGKLIRHFRADFGLAFDGDADRVVFVDDQGKLIDGDHMLGFLAHYLEHTGQLVARTVVTTQMRNTGLKVYLEGAGLRVIETPVGDKYVVEKLLELRQGYTREGQYALGGEQAGHIDIVNPLFTTGDGIRTALFVMRALRESGLPSLTSFADSVGKTPQIIASAYVGLGERHSKQHLADLEKQLIAVHPSLLRANLRYSGTEPLLRVMLESSGRLTETDLAGIAWSICRDAQALAGAEDGSIDILNCTSGGVIAHPEAAK